LAVVLLSAGVLESQGSNRAGSDSGLLPISFSTSEGTWMSLSNGSGYLWFDLLGDIYRVPAAGGVGRLIRGGLAWETRPRISPDGKTLAFISDKDGQYRSVWLSDAEGAHDVKLNVSENNITSFAWSPDSTTIVSSLDHSQFSDDRMLLC